MAPQQFSIRRVLTYVAILSLLLYFTLSWLNMMGNLYERTGSDFNGFYSFGRIAQEHGFASIYRIEKQQKVQEELVGHPVTPIFYTHLPFIAPIARALVNDDYVESFQRWALVLLLLNAINVAILVRLLNTKSFAREALFILAAGAYLFDPTFSGFMNGQDTAILLLGAAVWVWAFFSGNPFLSGLGLSLTTVRPQIALFLAIPFLFHHRRVFWGFAAGASVLALFSIALLGIDGTLRFVESIRYIEGTVWREVHALDMPTISGIVRRNFEISNIQPVKNAIWVCYLLGVAAFCFLWGRSARIDERHIGLLSLFAIFLVPYAHYHDLILLLIPIFCLLRKYQRETDFPLHFVALVPLTISWLLTLGFLGSGSLKFLIVYAVMFALGYLLVRPIRVTVQNPSNSVA